MKLSDFGKCVTSMAARRIAGMALGVIAGVVLLGTGPALAQTDPSDVPGECKASCDYDSTDTEYDWDFSSDDDDSGYYDPGWTPAPTVDPRIQTARSLNDQGIAAFERRKEDPGALNEAERFFRQAMEYEDHPQYHKNLADVLNSKGVLLYSAKDYDGAIAFYEEALRWDATNDTARRNLWQAKGTKANNTGVRYANAGDYETALRYYEDAIRFDPDSEIIRQNLTETREILESRQREIRVAQQESKIKNMVADLADAWDTGETVSQTNASAGLDFMEASTEIEDDVESGKQAGGEIGKLSGDFSPGNTGRTPGTEAGQGRREIAVGSGAKGQAEAARASGKMAVREPTAEGAAEEAGCAFDGSCTAVPAGANDPNVVVVGSESSWEEDVPESVKSTPKWQALEREAKQLEKERAVTRKKIAEIEKKLESAPDEERPILQVELVKARDEDDKVKNKQFKNESDKKLVAFGAQDFGEVPASEAAASTDSGEAQSEK